MLRRYTGEAIENVIWVEQGLEEETGGVANPLYLEDQSLRQQSNLDGR